MRADENPFYRVDPFRMAGKAEHPFKIRFESPIRGRGRIGNCWHFGIFVVWTRARFGTFIEPLREMPQNQA